MTDEAVADFDRWLSNWQHTGIAAAMLIQWGMCAAPLRLTLAHRWVGITTGEVEPAVSWAALTPDTLHPLAVEAFDRGPVDLPEFGAWLTGYMSSLTITGHGVGWWDRGIGVPPEPTLLIQLDHGRLDLGIVVRSGAMEVAPCQIAGDLIPV